ncbi:MAG TPA: hypothetical protein VF092_25055 [Longimicrobium sp.]
MEIEQRASGDGAEAAAAARVDGGTAGTRGEVGRMRITDPEAWHDLAERGTPRNG